jgi:hypothetical protein
MDLVLEEGSSMASNVPGGIAARGGTAARGVPLPPAPSSSAVPAAAVPGAKDASTATPKVPRRIYDVNTRKSYSRGRFLGKVSF